MNTDTTFIIADNQYIIRRGMHEYISDIFGECCTEDVADKRELVRTLMNYGREYRYDRVSDMFVGA